MTSTERDTFILDIQGKLATYGSKLSDALNIGKCTDSMKRNSILATMLLGVLYRFKGETPTICTTETVCEVVGLSLVCTDIETCTEAITPANCLTEEDFCRIRNKILTLIK